MPREVHKPYNYQKQLYTIIDPEPSPLFSTDTIIDPEQSSLFSTDTIIDPEPSPLFSTDTIIDPEPSPLFSTAIIIDSEPSSLVSTATIIDKQPPPSFFIVTSSEHQEPTEQILDLTMTRIKTTTPEDLITTHQDEPLDLSMKLKPTNNLNVRPKEIPINSLTPVIDLRYSLTYGM
ncbi:Hypothetical predicted protein [Mytilus galloprovincialis]|uniref:Uncharacterized protein n=1 Tax=Mytilus galloprovincialis TaxID=29158 RepID=A0A8B6GGC9_MYTGA|nr:Hypothetical predicted protein [Mytilus galloprovincialis]